MKKTIFRYFKNRILVMLSFMIVSFVIFFSNNEVIKANQGYQNAYLCCFVDDTSNTYRTQILYTGATIEYGNVVHLFPNTSLNSKMDGGGYAISNGRVNLYEGEWQRGISNSNIVVSYNGDDYITSLTLKEENNGKFELKIREKGSGENEWLNETEKSKVKIYYDLFDNMLTEAVSAPYSPCTFPFPTRNAKASDINRAYEVQDAISNDFMNALLFINDGENFKSVDDLIQTAYFVCTSGNNTQIKNNNGNTFELKWELAPSSNDTKNYTFKLTITRVLSSSGGAFTSEDKTQSFTYGVKKGYLGCSNNDIMETGAKNTLSRADISPLDTFYITWEHLYTNAGVLYENGVTYANQGDIFALSDMESKIVDVTRNLLGGLRSMLQLYTMEDCIFNNGIRGSSAFVYGIYNESWNGNINTIFLMFASISISLVALSIIKLVATKELSAISPAMRVSLIDGIKNILMSVMFIGFAYLMFRLAFLINFKFVDIFTRLVGDRKLSEVGSYSTLASVIYQFAYFVITLYVNFVYIMRGLIVPFFMMIAPICLYAFSLGKIGQKVTETWLKEFLGYVFIQSIHAFVYGFCIISSLGLRGIESIILCASIIPLTSIARDVLGIGGGKLLDVASNLTTASTLAGASVVGAGLNIAGNAIGSVADKVGSVVGGNVATRVGKTIGSVSRMTGSGLASGLGTLTGAGLSTALGGENSSAAMQGANLMSHSMSDFSKSVSNEVGNVTDLAVDGAIVGGKAVASGVSTGVSNFRQMMSPINAQTQSIRRNSFNNSPTGSGRTVGGSASQSVVNSAISNYNSNAVPLASRQFHQGGYSNFGVSGDGRRTAEYNFQSNAHFNSTHGNPATTNPYVAGKENFEKVMTSTNPAVKEAICKAHGWESFTPQYIENGDSKIFTGVKATLSKDNPLYYGQMSSSVSTESGTNHKLSFVSKDDYSKMNSNLSGDLLNARYDADKRNWENNIMAQISTPSSRKEFCDNNGWRKAFSETSENGISFKIKV